MSVFVISRFSIILYSGNSVARMDKRPVCRILLRNATYCGPTLYEIEHWLPRPFLHFPLNLLYFYPLSRKRSKRAVQRPECLLYLQGCNSKLYTQKKFLMVYVGYKNWHMTLVFRVACRASKKWKMHKTSRFDKNQGVSLLDASLSRFTVPNSAKNIPFCVFRSVKKKNCRWLSTFC